jgi:hypothetical protein
MIRHRHALPIAAIALTLLATAACGPSGGSAAAATTEPIPVGVLGDNPTTTATTTDAPPAAAPTYAGTAQAYAEEILAAWANAPTGRLVDLTSPAAHEKLVEIPGPINQGWHYARCEGAAGSSYCTFLNDVGDMITLQLTNQLLGGAHAGVGVLFDQVTFPGDAVAYVKAFIGGWQQGNVYRMKILSNDAEVSYFTHYTPPTTFSTCLNFVSGVPYVLVYNAEGLRYGIEVGGPLGKAHAITSHIQPTLLSCS